MRVCAACGRENPPDARFCNGCGAALSAGPVSRQQRKTVTVLFCDVTGSTALGEQLDPESFRQVMARFFETARGVIERHGGTVEKFIGDAVMAVFGVPVLHEDDALRAVRAAAGVREAIAVLNTELEAAFGATVGVRTGVNTGPVVTGTEERLATGDAVNLAARLEQAAAPGEIVIGAQTWALVRGAVTAEPLAPLAVKGKSEPVAAFRLLQVRAEVDLRSRPGRAPLVGRASQLRMLGEAFGNVVAERSCGLFTVLGMAGVGKSRLAAEFLRGVDARVVTGTCLSYGQGITYWPVVSMVKQLLDPELGCPGAAQLMAADAKVAAAISVLLGQEGAVTSPAEIAWAVRKLFESCAELAPLVVVFDDLHWGEPALFGLVEHVADLSRGAPILLLCLARPELLDARSGWGGGKLNATTLLLEPLQPAETAALVREARRPIEQSGDPAAQAALEYAAGYIDYARGRHTTALAAFTRAMEHARRAGDRWLETSIRAKAASSVYLGPTPVPEALRWLDDGRAQSPTYQPQLDTMKAALLAELGRFGQARSLLAETITQMNERGLAFLAAHAMQVAWRIEMLAGDDAAAERVARRGCEQLERLGEHSFLSTQACQLADALYALGRYEDSWQWALRGLELGSSDDLATQFLGLSVQSRLLARTGDIGAALALAEQVDALATISDDPRDSGDAALSRAEISYLAGDPAQAGKVMDQAIEHYGRKGATAYISRARRLAAAWASSSFPASASTPAQPATQQANIRTDHP